MAIDEKKLIEESTWYPDKCFLVTSSDYYRNGWNDCNRDWLKRFKNYRLKQKTSDNWIPCTERLPEKECLCLVTIKNKNGGYKVNTELYSYDNYGIGGFWTFDYIVAWMPLPEPYKGEE